MPRKKRFTKWVNFLIAALEIPPGQQYHGLIRWSSKWPGAVQIPNLSALQGLFALHELKPKIDSVARILTGSYSFQKVSSEENCFFRDIFNPDTVQRRDPILEQMKVIPPTNKNAAYISKIGATVASLFPSNAISWQNMTDTALKRMNCYMPPKGANRQKKPKITKSTQIPSWQQQQHEQQQREYLHQQYQQQQHQQQQHHNMPFHPQQHPFQNQCSFQSSSSSSSSASLAQHEYIPLPPYPQQFAHHFVPQIIASNDIFPTFQSSPFHQKTDMFQVEEQGQVQLVSSSTPPLLNSQYSMKNIPKTSNDTHFPLMYFDRLQPCKHVIKRIVSLPLFL